MALLHVGFFSHVLGMSCSMDVILPEKTRGQIGMEGYKPEGPLQTLYLLHGMSDDHTIWQRRTSIERYVADLGIAVVMPTVHLSWYTNQAHGLKYWDFISRELPSICQGFFHLSPKREDNFAAGLSMGGYGATKLGLGAPDAFCAVASLSGALDVRGIMENNTEPFWLNTFGSADQLDENDNDLLTLAQKCKDTAKVMPKLYQWCGTEDFCYASNVKFRDHARALGFDLTYEENPGDHQWKYWDEKIQRVLEWLPIRKG